MQDTLEGRIAQDAKVYAGAQSYLGQLGWLQQRQQKRWLDFRKRIRDEGATTAHSIGNVWAVVANHVGARQGIPCVWQAYERGEWGQV